MHTHVVADEQGQGVREVRVTVIEPGQEPRRPLRYEVEPGTTEQVEIQWDWRLWQATEGRVIEQANPRVTLVAEIAIDQVEDGEIRVSGEYVSLEIDRPALEGEPLSPLVMERILGPLVGATFWAHLTDRGVELEVGFEPARPMPPLSAELAEGAGLDKPLDQLVEVMPAEPVGVGAVWEVHDRPESFGVVSERMLRREVVDWDEGMVTLGGPLTIKAEDQEMVSRMTPGARTQLLTTESKGEREARLRLDRLMPVTATLEGRTESEMQLETRTQTDQIIDWMMQFRAVE
ncbi:MAG: hypothetical protein WD294_01570 [Phycisphaeraceae bacterium]